MVKLFLQRFADVIDPNVQDKINGDTPLHLLARTGSEEIAKLLVLYLKADVNLTNHRNETPLHIAVRNNLEGLVRCFVVCGADLTLQNQDGSTPVDIAQQQVTKDPEFQKVLNIILGNDEEESDNNESDVLSDFEDDDTIDSRSAMVLEDDTEDEVDDYSREIERDDT